MTPLLADLVQKLDLEELDTDLFRGENEYDRHGRLFGGQVLGQALVAAGRTALDRPAHSLHGYFLRPGDPAHPVLYEVERVRDGRSFSTRRVVARQHARPIFEMLVAFHAPEPGFEHDAEMPQAPDPESLQSPAELARELGSKLPAGAEWATKERAIDMRFAKPTSLMASEPRSDVQLAWFRAQAELPDDPLLHQALIAYTSDMWFNDNAIRPHDRSRMVDMASLDHALWLHEPVRADQWLLFVMKSPKAAGARGFVRGEIFTRDGRLVASVAQDSLMRPAPE